MSEQVLSLPWTAAAGLSRRRAAGSLSSAIVLGNAGVIVWLWIHGGNWTLASTGDVLTSIARLTGLLSAYLALLQVVLLARVPALERLVGFDRLSVWHRRNGHACLYLVVAHVVAIVIGYAALDRLSTWCSYQSVKASSPHSWRLRSSRPARWSSISRITTSGRKKPWRRSASVESVSRANGSRSPRSQAAAGIEKPRFLPWTILRGRRGAAALRSNTFFERPRSLCRVGSARARFVITVSR